MNFPRAPRLYFCLFLMLAQVLPLPAIRPVFAQPAKTETPGESAKMLEDVRAKIARGRTQLNSNQVRSIDTLRDASQQSLDALTAFLGPEVLKGPAKIATPTGFGRACCARQQKRSIGWAAPRIILEGAMKPSPLMRAPRAWLPS